jgi:WXG100 family type VII secretion target
MAADPVALFKADLQQMKDALGTTEREHARIVQSLAALKTEFGTVPGIWQSPASVTYEDVSNRFATVSDEFQRVLADAVSRLRAAVQTYEDAERANFSNMT